MTPPAIARERYGLEGGGQLAMITASATREQRGGGAGLWVGPRSTAWKRREGGGWADRSQRRPDRPQKETWAGARARGGGGSCLWAAPPSTVRPRDRGRLGNSVPPPRPCVYISFDFMVHTRTRYNNLATVFGPSVTSGISGSPLPQKILFSPRNETYLSK